MKKLSLVVFILLLISGKAFAQSTSKSFIVSATVPKATSVGININRVDAGSSQWTPVTSMSLSFDPLTLNPQFGTYLPNHYFVGDIAPIGGAADMSTTFDYLPGSTPAGQAKSLGDKTTITFMKASGSGTDTQETALTSHGPKKTLKNVSGETITGSETQSGWLRFYLGMVTKDPKAVFPDPEDSEPMTIADMPGVYTETLRITTTIN